MTWPNAGPHATKVIDGKSTGNRANKKRVGQTVASEMRTLPPKITVSSSAARPCPPPAAIIAEPHLGPEAQRQLLGQSSERRTEGSTLLLGRHRSASMSAHTQGPTPQPSIATSISVNSRSLTPSPPPFAR